MSPGQRTPVGRGEGRGPFQIVINYRREDTAGHAGRLYDSLAQHFGSKHVFMDIDAIDPGADFTEVIAGAIDRSQAFISLIGKRWLAATDSSGRRRLDNPDDFVRIEIESALQRDIRVIPVLVQDVEMPSSDDLPASMRPLARRNALEIRDSSWRYDVDRLIATLDQIAGAGEPEKREPPVPPEPAPRRRLDRRVAIAIGAAVVIAVAVAIGVLAFGGGDGTPPPDGSSGDRKLLYADGRNIYAAGVSGGDEVNLTRGAGEDGSPAWAPDHERIAFVREGDLWVMDYDGSAGHPITSGGKDGSPDWSPDGERIAFDRETSGGTDVLVMDADGGTPTNLTPDATTGGAPDFSPDSERLVFQRKRNLWLMDADGTNQREIPIGLPARMLFPAWAPDGSEIAFTLFSSDGKSSDVYLVRPDGTGLRNLTQGQLSRPNYATWSTDSEQIAVATRNGIWRIDRDGSGRERIVRGRGLERPAWAL
jgi:hypothetical protein